MQQTSNTDQKTAPVQSTLFSLVGINARKRLLVRAVGQRKVHVALLMPTLAQAEVADALARRWHAVGEFRPGLAWPILSHFVTTSAERLSQTKTLHADAIVLGNHRATLYVDDEGLCVRSRKILVHARRRLRLSGGSVDLG